jgi:hypothetical protein
MISLPADENLDANIVRGVLRRLDDIDIVRLQDLDLTGADDPAVLAWAADHGRVLVMHEVEPSVQLGADQAGLGPLGTIRFWRNW